MNYKLPYVIGKTMQVHETPLGYSMTEGLEAYNNGYAREKVIVKLDLMQSLGKIFEEDTLVNKRSLLCFLITGTLSTKGRVSQVVKALYLEDRKFKRYVGELIYFRLDEKSSLYDRLQQEIASVLEDARDEIISKSEACKLSIIAESELYIYAAVPDKKVVSVPKGYKEEWISCAKNWCGELLYK